MPKGFPTFCIFLLCLYLGIFKSNCQELTNRNGTPLSFKIYSTEDNLLDLQKILSTNTTFIDLDSVKIKTNPKSVNWLQIDLKNHLLTLQKDSLWYLRFNNFEYLSIYYRAGDSIVAEKWGVFEKVPKGTSVLYRSGFPFNEQSLIDGRYLYLKAQRLTYIDNPLRWKISFFNRFQNELILEYYNTKDLGKLIPVYTFGGICLVIFILTLAYYLYSKRLEFLFYTTYVLFLFLYLSADILQLHELFFGKFNLVSYAFFQVPQILINLFYILFVIYYLNSREYYPRLHRALVSIALLLGLTAILSAIFILSANFQENIHLLDFERIIMTLFGLIGMIYLLVKTRDKLGYFIVVGSFMYMIGALGLLFFKLRLYMILGSSFEILIFASGLTYKIQQEYIERLRFQKESTMFENKALRAQMNPHFIFNSLSSIQYLITTDKKEKAVKYLNKFSLLMRNLLESAIEANVLLTEEISLLHKYLELEALRFNNTFFYTITVDENIDADIIEVPALLFQPFVENAILHGLLSKKDSSKVLRIHFKKKDNFLFCEIEDNGIGREASEKSKSLLQSGKKSRGIEVTEKRLQLFNHSNEINLSIIDKKNADGEATGTLVIIKISI